MRSTSDTLFNVRRRRRRRCKRKKGWPSQIALPRTGHSRGRGRVVVSHSRPEAPTNPKIYAKGYATLCLEFKIVTARRSARDNFARLSLSDVRAHVHLRRTVGPENSLSESRAPRPQAGDYCGAKVRQIFHSTRVYAHAFSETSRKLYRKRVSES